MDTSVGARISAIARLRRAGGNAQKCVFVRGSSYGVGRVFVLMARVLLQFAALQYIISSAARECVSVVSTYRGRKDCSLPFVWLALGTFDRR